MADPDDLRTQRRAPLAGAGQRSASYTVTVVSGPDADASVVIDGSRPSRTLIGTSPACDLRLTDPEISRRHAALELERGALRVTDLDSTNGTYVDNVRVVEALLSGGETLAVGASLLRVERAVAQAPLALPVRVSFGNVIGASVEMRRLYGLCERIAAADIPVVIEGETGTGKEALAEAIHEVGPRSAEPFVVFDCTAVPASLVESELFGHERGAFTGATTARTGILEQAHKGTVLIDEIGDLDLALQPKLLRAVERREIRRVGGNRTIALDVRIVAATRRNLDEEVQKGRFRDDLFHRLAVARIELPPLRRRRGDVTLLARHFCRQFGGDAEKIPVEVYRRWEEYAWPGNIRELRNAVARHLALGDWAGSALSAQPSSPSVSSAAVTGPADIIAQTLDRGLSFVQARQQVQDEFERRYLERVLADHGGNIGRAAAAAGVGRRYFQRLRARGR